MSATLRVGPSLVLIGIIFLVAGLGLCATGPGLFGGAGVLFAVSGGGVLLGQRWAMFMGLLPLVVVVGFFTMLTLDSLPTAGQTGSFADVAAIGLLLSVAICAVPFVILLRAALKR